MLLTGSSAGTRTGSSSTFWSWQKGSAISSPVVGGVVLPVSVPLTEWGSGSWEGIPIPLSGGDKSDLVVATMGLPPSRAAASSSVAMVPLPAGLSVSLSASASANKTAISLEPARFESAPIPRLLCSSAGALMFPGCSSPNPSSSSSSLSSSPSSRLSRPVGAKPSPVPSAARKLHPLSDFMSPWSSSLPDWLVGEDASCASPRVISPSHSLPAPAGSASELSPCLEVEG
mmetsp:Transcript_40839/g.115518  ORF Transcript_40839/g.115518 Transcript_40839/m.115518 type:complete len:230 (+) Transcript_40839:1916-2605(+)